MTAVDVEVGGRPLRLTSLDKVLWPQAGFTKAELVDYYTQVAPALLPHLADRVLMMARFPEGVEGRGFAQTECRGAPDWVRTHAVRLRTGEMRSFCVVEDVASLAWVANLGTLELHPFPARTGDPARPTWVVFDLDPGPPADVVDCCRVALRLGNELERFGLSAFAKTSGGLGLHVVVPVTGSSGFGETKAFARAVASRLAADFPESVTDRQARSLRAGKVLVDWLQNDPMRSTVAPYSLRAMPFPTVSMPVSWDEVEVAARHAEPAALTFVAGDVLGRLERLGELFAPVLSLSQTLPAALI